MAGPQHEGSPIIIKRVKKVSHGGHHGGAWKIAYADFVTAMMAFFLLMWLLGSSTQGDLKGISDYFNTPLKVAVFGGSGSGDSSSIVRGGGQDLSRQTGQRKRGEDPAKRATINLRAAEHEFERQEKARLQSLKDKLDKLLEASEKLKQFENQIQIDFTDEGLRIQILDEKNRPMFDSGRAVLKPYFIEILHELAHVFNDVPNPISISGHTDSAAYLGGNTGYSNWELSADRANAARRELVAAGIGADKVLRVMGLADSVPFDGVDTQTPNNRRISIVLLNQHSQDFLKQGGVEREPQAVAPELKPELGKIVSGHLNNP